MSLTPVMDPSGLLERAPRLAELLPDAALSEALARGDAWTVYAVLERRLKQEPPGPARELLAKLVEDRAAFVIAARSPATPSILGTGVQWRGTPPGDAPGAPYVADRTVTVLGVPVWPLEGYLVRADGAGPLQVVGRVPPSRRRARHRAGAVAGVVLGLCAAAGVGEVWWESRKVRIVTVVNGLSRPVDVRIGDQHWVVAPGAQEQGSVKQEDEWLHAIARWPGADEKPIEDVVLPVAGAHFVYNVKGAALLDRRWGSKQYFQNLGPLRGSVSVLLEDETVQAVSRNWESTARLHSEAGKWQLAADVAAAVAEVEPGNTLARELAARAVLQLDLQAPVNLPDALRWRNTRDFAWMLMNRWQQDLGAQSLAQDLLVFIGQGPQARARYAEHAEQFPDSPLAALYLLRADTPSLDAEQEVLAYEELVPRFPDSPEVFLAWLEARLRFELRDPGASSEEGAPTAYALETARQAEVLVAKHPPTTVGALEVLVRIFLDARRRDAATGLVHRFGQDPRNRTWDFLVLAGRTAEVAGPEHTPYVMRDWVPPALARQPERMRLLELLTGQRSLKEAERMEVTSPVDRAVLGLTRDVLENPTRAMEQAAGESEAVLSRLEPEVAALLALELERAGDARARRLFNASLPLMLSREALRGFRISQTRSAPRSFARLAPGLRAAALLVRARDKAREGYRVFTERLDGLSRMDALGGFAVRAAPPWIRSAFDACMDTKVPHVFPSGLMSQLTGSLAQAIERQENDREGRRPRCEARVVTPTGLPLPRATPSTPGNANGADP
ncbi:hypothetical protein [Corallococcus silvisoli]|uniref:hypothetical protein n=1 Tax=Corallococcus silvisoli TaxID=2697031 RepID=UPI001378A4E9|nr:hypothetical protein [Corallococcus silvisoli]NBD10103.1 hypothetical protein [Corallococcus silvisoli]